jgi:hypothetical protein
VGFFLAYGFLWGGVGGCLFTFFTFVHILFVALFFVSFLYVLMKQIKTNQKSIGKSFPAYEFSKFQEKKSANQKVSRLLPNVCDFQKENHILGHGFKNI